ncbi:hypothetical protein CHS0354_024991 [Potamilus streckersoni]|uniref:Uncharacterized protein n=1 Tax=Potamilus streckersoni TaxID=2493646 RepID=A0AAE0W6A4_9BIVA|nr:hypothetical protein CHS0354_024991 [Potamilus streckersoni]
MGARSIQLFQEALKDGKVTVYHIRVMVVGHLGVGKTTLIKRLLGEEVNIFENHSTEGIDVYNNCCDASLSTLEWTRQTKHSELDDQLQLVVRVLNEQQSARGKVADNDQVAILPQGETTDIDASVSDEQVIIIHQEEATDSSATVTNEEQVIILPQGETTDTDASVTHEEQVIILPQGETTDTDASVTHEEQVIILPQGETTDIDASVTDEQVIILPKGETTHIDASVTDEEQVIITHQEEETDINPTATEVITAHQEETSDSNPSVMDKEQVPPFKSHSGAHYAFENKDTELLYHHSPQQGHALNLATTSSQLEKLPSARNRRKLKQTKRKIPMLEKYADKLKQDTGENAKVTIWDFAGQYAFYTTHQIFLTQRAIYLLVSDVSKQVTDLVVDHCYFDSKGMIRCNVHELTEVWLNSIHSCAASPNAGTPPVILVGTHADKIQKQSSAKLENLERQSTMRSTSTDAGSAMGEEDSFEPPRKQARLELTTVASMTGVHAIPSEDQLKKQTISKMLSGSGQEIVQTDVIAGPSTENPVGEIIEGADTEKDSHEEIFKGYFREIRSYLEGKPTRFHLVDEDFVIDNTVVDKRLEDLKKKIVEVASQQPYWGEDIPARWIILEQELMNQKAAGVKMISLEEVENLNKKGTIQIKTSEEMDLFLRYLHEKGIIIYFSVKELRDNILLDPIWLSDALKSLINAQPSLPESSADNRSQSTSLTDNEAQSTTPADSGSQSTSLTDIETLSPTHVEIGSRSTSQTDQYAESTTLADSGSQSTSLTDNDSLSTTPADNGFQSTTPDDSGSQSTSHTDNDRRPTTPAEIGFQSTSHTDNEAQPTTSADCGSQSTSHTDNETQPTTSADCGSQSTSHTDNETQPTTSADCGSQSTSLTDNDPQSTTPADSGSQSTSLIDNDPQSTIPADCGSQSTSLFDNAPQSTTPADSGSQSLSHAGYTVAQRWSDFKKKGILHLELVDALWTEDKYPEFHAHKDNILLIMEQLNIIAKPRSFSEIGVKVENYFLIPCMLRKKSPKNLIYPRRDPRIESTPVLYCIFRGKFLPPPIFHRLLAACVAHWPIAKKETSKHLIFCGCCVFDLDLFHRLLLCFKNHVISARITRMAIDEVKIPDAKLCSQVRRFITSNLSKITSCLGQNLQYDLSLTCQPSQMWLADEVHHPDAPITPEHMNHARLCVALVTVCGNALKDILLTKVPAPHNDIYQALLAKQADLTTKRQVRPGHWQNALLNQDQIQLVFPREQDQKTGTVDQFHLSLLYTLIRNVSTVTAPLTGWGNDPQPSDISLGASVERIHSYRNHISGHFPDGRLSQQDFEDYWNKFRAVLEDIEKALGTQAYRAQLEKQTRQVLSVYEAC